MDFNESREKFCDRIIFKLRYVLIPCASEMYELDYNMAFLSCCHNSNNNSDSKAPCTTTS